MRITDIADDGTLKPDTFRSLPPEVAQPYLLKDGDLLFARSGATVGKSVMYSEAWGPCCFAGYLIRARPDSGKALPEYIRYFSESRLYWQHITSEQIQATIQNVSAERYGNLPVAMPDIAGQRGIVRFLDRETAKVDALIAKQEHLIATLREDRAATITHTVTRGLDPQVEMTETGVEWLGEVPAHWHQAQLRHIVDRIEQGVSPEAYAELADDGWGVLKAGCVNGGVFQDVQHKKLPAGFEIDPSIVVKEGDLLVCRASGSPDLVGSTAVVRQLRYNLILSDKTFRLIAGSRIAPYYLEWAMNSRIYREQVRGAISGAEGLANNLPMSSLRSFRFPVPPLSEQKHIVVHLDERCSTIDALIEKAEESISILREYRSALITDAVTGKIDVWGAA